MTNPKPPTQTPPRDYAAELRQKVDDWLASQSPAEIAEMNRQAAESESLRLERIAEAEAAAARVPEPEPTRRTRLQMIFEVAKLGVSDRALRCYVGLQWWRNWQTGEAWPSRKLIARVCGAKSIDWVKRALRELEAAGVIAREYRASAHGRQGSNIYRFNAEFDPLSVPLSGGANMHPLEASPSIWSNPEHVRDHARVRPREGDHGPSLHTQYNVRPMLPGFCGATAPGATAQTKKKRVRRKRRPKAKASAYDQLALDVGVAA